MIINFISACLQAVFYVHVGYAEDLRRGFQKFAAYWRRIVVGAF